MRATDKPEPTRPQQESGPANLVATLMTSASAALQAREWERAIQLYDQAIASDPDHAEAHYKRGNAHGALGRLEAALADYDQAILGDACHANAHCNRGAVLTRLLRWDEALDSYDRALVLNPRDHFAYYNRGAVLRELGRLDESLASYERAIELKDDYVEAYINRAHVLQELRRHELAIASYDKAIELKPVHAAAFQGRGSSLLELKRFDAAIADYGRAIALSPDYPYLRGMRRLAKMQCCDWSDLAEDVQKISAGLRAGLPVCAPFTALALVDSAALQRAAAEIWVRTKYPPNDALGAIPTHRRADKIRIGYFSADFRMHPVSTLTAQLFETHDRERFDITAFAFGPEAADPMRERLHRAFDRFIDVRLNTDIDVASLARELGIDIAVDLGGFTEHSRTPILALRAAPVQLSYIGYLGSLGAPYMDYLLADTTLIPEVERQHYSEKIIYLPSYQVNDSRRGIAERTFSRKELGLPPHGFAFACCNSTYKIMPATFAIWMRILVRVPGSVLFLFADNEVAERNFLKEAGHHGVDPRRLVFGGRLALAEYLARFRTFDLFLDTWPYNAGATASDALWAGLPVLTYAGSTFAGRVAASLLTAIDVPELITETPAAYEEFAVRLATNPAQLMQIRQKLQRHRLSTRLFDTVAFTRHLESGYRQVYERHLAGMAPEHVFVP